MNVAFAAYPQRISYLSLPEDTDPSELAELAQFADDLTLNVGRQWEEFPPKLQDVLTEFVRRVNVERAVCAWKGPRRPLPRAEEQALNEFMRAGSRLREAILDAIERDKSRGAFREYTDEQIKKWEEADKLPPDLAEWVKATLR